MTERNEKNRPTQSPVRQLRKERHDLQEQIDQIEKQMVLLNRQLQRESNRANYIKDGDRKRRTHRLCVKGGVIESLVPMLTDFTEKEFYELMEEIFDIPEVQGLLQKKTLSHPSEMEINNG